MQTLKELGEEYLDTAFNMNIKLEKLKLEQKSLSISMQSPDLERRIDFLYKEILQISDIGNHLINLEQRR